MTDDDVDVQHDRDDSSIIRGLGLWGHIWLCLSALGTHNNCFQAANVQLAVPPTLAAGDWSADNLSEGDGEGSSGDLHDGVSEFDNNNY